MGLAAYIAVLEGTYFYTRRPVFLRLSQFWLRIFAVSFGMGVVSGIVMPFQFGTNWSRYSDLTADVARPLMAYEVLTAFFLEAGFLGVLLFGRKRVPPGVHFFAGVMVAAGTLVSTFWILSANSWMQTPVGHAIVDGRFVPQDWTQIVFNPSFPYWLVHTTVAFFSRASTREDRSRGSNWETQARMPLLLFAWPDEAAERNHYEIGIPAMGSLILGPTRTR